MQRSWGERKQGISIRIDKNIVAGTESRKNEPGVSRSQMYGALP